MLLELCQKNVQKHCQTYNAEANVADAPKDLCTLHTHFMFLQEGFTLART